MQTLTLLSRRPVSDSLTVLEFNRPEGWDYACGQFARLGLDLGGEEPVFRAYSLASAPSENVLRFLVKTVTGGTLSPRLAALEPGDTVLLDGNAEGNLFADRIAGGTTLWMLATGAGLAPFMAYFKEKNAIARFSRIHVVIGARTVKDAEALADLVRPLADDRVSIITTVTREDHTLTGRITDLIDSGRLEDAAQCPLCPEQGRYMLCGNPAFVQDTRNLLKARGIVSPRFGKPGQLIVETLW